MHAAETNLRLVSYDRDGSHTDVNFADMLGPGN